MRERTRCAQKQRGTLLWARTWILALYAINELNALITVSLNRVIPINKLTPLSLLVDILNQEILKQSHGVSIHFLQAEIKFTPPLSSGEKAQAMQCHVLKQSK